MDKETYEALKDFILPFAEYEVESRRIGTDYRKEMPYYEKAIRLVKGWIDEVAKEYE